MSTTSNTEKPQSAWIVFNNRVRALLIAGGAEKPAVMQFASFLKSKNAEYDTWADPQIVAEFRTWTPPPKEAKEPKAKKEKAPKTEKAEKREPTPWLLFLGRVRNTLNVAAAGSDDPVFQELSSKIMQFASALKAQNASYDAWTDAKIVKEFRGWVPPPKAPKEPKAEKPAKSSASESGSEGKKERKKPAPKTAEENAAIAAKRKATREANKAAKSASESDEEKPAKSSASESGSEGKKERKKPAPKTAEENAAIAAKRKATRDANKAAKADAAPAFTMEQLQDWEPVEGTEYGKNARGDVIDGDRQFIGHMKADGSIDRKAKRPADWEKIIPADE